MTQVRACVLEDAEWKRVSKVKPCPICCATEGCHLHEDEDFASCQHQPSDWLLVTGQWLHRTIGKDMSLRPTG